MAQYYASFSQCEFDLVIVEGNYTVEHFGLSYFNQPELANNEQAKS
ncbi:hypothetical protein [Paenibacillus polymyxa]|nr:hypothetical protein [Paenibacillus polymyxa]WCM60729.1 hypothetical protein OYT09_22685 [Paenibacillus polymyxa]